MSYKLSSLLPGRVRLELKKAPVDYTKIGVYERQSEDLKDELRMYIITADLAAMSAQ